MPTRKYHSDSGQPVDTENKTTAIDSELKNRTADDLNALLLALNDTALVSETDSLGNITYANDKFVETSKYSRKELMGKNHRLLKSGEHNRKYYEKLWSTIVSGKVWRGKIKNMAKDGTFYWVDTSIAPIMNKNGVPIKFISVRFPITEQMEFQKKMERLNSQLESRIRIRTEVLRKSARHFSDLTNSMPQLVWTANPKGIVDYYNDKYKNYEGIIKRGKEYVWTPVVHPEDSEKTVNAWKTAIKLGTTYEVEHRIKIKNGDYRWHLSRGVPLKNEEGKIIKWYGTATDIHDRKKLEQQKDEFLGVASHELKTPLTSVKAYAQVLQAQFKEKGDEKSAVLLEKLDSQLNKLTALIGDLLDVTKIESGKLKLNPTYFDFNQLVEEIAAQMQLTTSEHRIEKELDYPSALLADRDRVGQVIINLISNAIKYSPNSEEIVLKSKKESNRLIFSVRDFGIGVSEENKTKVFERFFRIQGEGRETFPGLGLGLYISQEIIKRHGGSMGVESSRSGGTVFYFSLPLNGIKLLLNPTSHLMNIL